MAPLLGHYDDLAIENDELFALEDGTILTLESSIEGAPVYDEVPTLPIPYVYKHESFTIQPGDPDEDTEPRYYEAWQNQSTTTPVPYPVEYIHGNYYLVEYFFMQLSTPVFSPDGTGVRAPTAAKLLNEGKGDLILVGPA